MRKNFEKWWNEISVMRASAEWSSKIRWTKKSRIESTQLGKMMGLSPEFAGLAVVVVVVAFVVVAAVVVVIKSLGNTTGFSPVLGGLSGNFIGGKCKLSVKFCCASVCNRSASIPNKAMVNFIFLVYFSTVLISIVQQLIQYLQRMS